MIPYILHVSILIAAGFLFYKLVLKKLTFYIVNRWILLSCLVIAFVLPLLPMPTGWVLQGIAARETKIVAGPERSETVVNKPALTVADRPETGTKIVANIVTKTAANTFVNTKTVTKTASGPVTTKSSLKPVSDVVKKVSGVVSPVVNNTHGDAVGTSRQIAHTGPVSFVRVLQVLFYLYLLGVLLLGLNLLRQMGSLLLQSYRGPVIRDGQFRIITTAGMHSPCSFGRTIFIHPDRYDPDTYHQILLHEKIHAGGWHTVDIILAELGIVFQWFNPFIWWFRRELENNLEFLTDRNVLKSPGIERSAYQLSLVKVAAPDLPLSITSNYNQSLLKRRIIMMNVQNSARHSAWKYFFLAPLFLFLAAILNRPAVMAQNSKDHSSSSRTKKAAVPAPATAPVTIPFADPAVDPQPATAPAPAVASSTAPLPVVDPAIQTPSLPTPAVPAPAAPLPAAPIPARSAADTIPSSLRSDRTEGAWFIVNSTDKKEDKINIELKSEKNYHDWNCSFTVLRSQLVNFTSVGKVDFTLTREAGTMHFTGNYDGEQGLGHYKFQPDAAFLTHMQEKKIDMEEDQLFEFFILDIKKGYVDMLQANGFPDVSRNRLISMAALGIDENYIKSIRGSGYSDITENQLISFKALHIDKAFIDDIHKAGYEHPAVSKLVTFKSMNINGDYIRRFPSGSPEQDIITYKSLNIDSAYVASLKRVGYTSLSSQELVSLKSLGVTAEYVKNLESAGYKDIPVHRLTSFKSMDITGEYIKSFEEVGFKDIPEESLTSLKAMGVTPEYVKGFIALGYKNITPHHLTSLKAMNITPEYVKAFNAIGFKDIPLNQLSSLKALGVTADYVVKMKEKGFVSDDLNKYIRLKNAFE